MSTYTRLGGRGSRYAKSKARDERNADSLYDRGVLSRPGSFAPKPPSAELIIDDEFHSLIPPQTPEENAALEESLLRDGCNDALVVWQGLNILIDGHHRYELCTKHGISYTTRELAFDSREDVIVWMVQHQLGRRNISAFVRSELALRMKSAVEAKAKANMSAGGGNKKSGSATLPTPITETHTRRELAAAANVGERTLHKVENVTKNAPEPIKAKARSGEISVNRADLLTKALKGASDTITEFVTESGMDDPERVEILKRLEKSSGSPETNGTFDEIIRTGGFHFGDEESERVEDFVNAPIQQIQRGLDAIAKTHVHLKREERRQQAATTPLPEGKYRCIVIDPPWPVEKIVRDVRPNQTESLDYPTMTLEEIAALPIADLAYEDGCHLYLWTTQKFLPDALELMRAWDFKYQCVMTWVKPTGMTPYSWMYNTELVLFGRRGDLPLTRLGMKLSFDAASDKHSAKPDVFYERVLAASPSPRLEMFARKPREGFTVFGDEV